MNAQKHQELLQEYIAKGGDLKHSKSFEQFSLQNFAKLKYELKKLGDPIPKEEIKPPPPTPEKAKTYRPKPFDDLILEYPPALHSIFKKRWEVWLEACSLKIQLGNIPEKEHQDYTKKLHHLNLKKEQLQQKINELLECDKLLNKKN